MFHHIGSMFNYNDMFHLSDNNIHCLQMPRCGRCSLQNVFIYNRGIDWSSEDNVYWKHKVHRLESVKIVLHGNSEFEAHDVTLEVS